MFTACGIMHRRCCQRASITLGGITEHEENPGSRKKEILFEIQSKIKVMNDKNPVPKTKLYGKL